MIKALHTWSDRFSAKYRRLPKWLRFALQYGTAPLWFPAAVLAIIPLFIVSQVAIAVIETWDEFK